MDLRIFTYPATVACLLAWHQGLTTPENEKEPSSLAVTLPHPCSSRELLQRGDSRDITLRFVGGDRTLLNQEQLLPEIALRNTQDAMRTRAEQVISLSADPRLSYGEVVTLIDRLRQQTPNLYILLSTRSETGPIDPADPSFQATRLPPMLCPPEI